MIHEINLAGETVWRLVQFPLSCSMGFAWQVL